MNEAIMQFVEKYTKNQLIGYFLMMWGLTFFFSSISGFMWLIGGYSSGLDLLIDIFWNLADLGCATVLGLLGLKILEKPENNPEK
ncbi:MAG: hypothetical protein IAX21_02575 [Candidatus Bathyarchaeota archaeon]|nr:hypothetical protein [Candidatus Bathyarchaeum tardum]WGM90099.1 MAG: hypothetical protein NUK63_03000 [Candidatus Bathyarchaeum tardum]WNZ29763.1 MAG: hypothetical protein IAX21_02575 [Candidatus Bathyarchaeota archaeon]